MGQRNVKFCLLLLLPLLGVLCGCPVMQSEKTPVPQKYVFGSWERHHQGYWIYVPSTYNANRTWPLVITLHGTHGWDSASAQIREWKVLAEEKKVIVVSPSLKSVQGILPIWGVWREQWYKDLASDDQAVLGILDEVLAKYRIDPKAVLLSGFSAGGFVMYNTGLRHPERFDMLIARSCNCDIEMLDKIPLNPQVRKMPVVIFWGRDDPGIQKQCWSAVEFLTNHNFADLTHKKVAGGHLRRPDLAYKYWMPYMPKELRVPDAKPESAPSDGS